MTEFLVASWFFLVLGLVSLWVWNRKLQRLLDLAERDANDLHTAVHADSETLADALGKLAVAEMQTAVAEARAEAFADKARAAESSAGLMEAQLRAIQVHMKG